MKEHEVKPQMPSIFSPYPASFFPDIDTARHGLERAKYGKEPFKVTDYKVCIFNMGNEKDRTEYADLMKRLMPMAQDSQCVVNKNELQVLNTPDGQSWYRYVEWFEYVLNEKSLTTGADNAGSADSTGVSDGSDGHDVEKPAAEPSDFAGAEQSEDGDDSNDGDGDGDGDVGNDMSTDGFLDA